jgi:hypothetical protein
MCINNTKSIDFASTNRMLKNTFYYLNNKNTMPEVISKQLFF